MTSEINQAVSGCFRRVQCSSVCFWALWICIYEWLRAYLSVYVCVCYVCLNVYVYVCMYIGYESVCKCMEGYVLSPVYKCVCAWMYVLAYVCACVYMCEGVYACGYAHICVYIWMCIYLHVYVDIYMCKCVCACTCMYMCVNVCISMYVCLSLSPVVFTQSHDVINWDWFRLMLILASQI